MMITFDALIAAVKHIVSLCVVCTPCSE